MKKEIKIGDRYDFWEVMGFNGEKIICKCTACNITVKEHSRPTLVYKKSRSCGCQKKALTKDSWKERQLKSISIQVGDKIDSWTILELNNGTDIDCRCECGTLKTIKRSKLSKGISKSCGCNLLKYREQTSLDRYGCKNPSRSEQSNQKRKETCQKKYGADNPFYSEDVKNKIRQTNKERYGFEVVTKNKDVKKKAKETCLKRYDVDNPTKNPEIRQKAKDTLYANYGTCDLRKSEEINQRRIKTCQEKYQTDSPLESPQVQDKIKQTISKRYGVDNPRKSSIVIEKIKQRRILSGSTLTLSDGRLLIDVCKEFNVPWNNAYKVFHTYGEVFFLEYCINYKFRIYSTELKFIKILEKDIALQKYDRQPTEFKINRKPDFRIELNNRTLYVNVDGLYEHSEIGRSCNKDNNYHKELFENFSKNNQTIYQFREDELRDKPEIVRSLVLNYFGIYNKKLGARECIIKEISNKEAHSFFEKNHLMGSYKSSTPFGLYYKDDLVMCLSVRRIKEDQLEIARLATKNNYLVMGGLTKMLKFLKTKYNNIKKIISFCDFRYATGRGYKKIGFNLESLTLGWKWTDSSCTFNRLQCKANMDSRKLTQQQYADEFGWVKIYDAGQGKFTLNV